MLAMSPSCPATTLGLGWEYEYSFELGRNNNNNNNHIFDNLDFDSMFVANIDSSCWNNQTHQHDHDHRSQSNDDDDDDDGDIIINKQQQRSSESASRQGTSSTDDVHHHHNDSENPMLAKKLNHNASERDRRRKINSMYSSLRALLPANHHRKKLSIPATVGRVLEYIPELQKEVDDLIHKKQVILSKVSALQIQAGGGGSISNADAAGLLFIQESDHQEKLVKNNTNNNHLMKKKTTSSSWCSISANRLGEKEMVIQISAFQRISMAEVLLMLENNGFLVIDVSSFQSFGGTTFYILHLWMEGRYGVDDYEKLNEMLMSLLQNHNQIMQ